MLQGILISGTPELIDGGFSGVTLSEFNYSPIVDHIDDAVFGSDEFRMYGYKIKRCPRTRSHDWTECPYAHRGEKAQRRDPRKFTYSAVACPAFRNGSCQKGDFCEFAHGVFEYWLHPARYRTRACNAGRYCQRKVCFFAHTPEQLRSETKYKFNCKTSRQQMPGTVVYGGDISEMASERKKEKVAGGGEGLSEILYSLKGLKMRDIGGEREKDRNIGKGWDVSDTDLHNIGWISELVQ